MGLNDSEGSVPSLACRGLGMQRSVKSQALTLHRGPIVLHSQSIANPHKARAFCCLCRFHPAVDVAGFSTSALVCFFFFSLPFFTPALLFVSRRLSPSVCFFPATARRLYLVYLLGPTRRSKPQLVAKVATLRPRLTAPKQESGGTLDSLSYYLGRRPAMPLTLCHVACSHYKPSGSRGPPACILSVCVYTSALVLVRGSNPSFPTGFWKHFVHLLMFCVSASSPSRPRRSHFYLLSPLTAEGMTGSRRKRFVSS